MKIAVVGGGGAGLACAWLLEEAHEIALFEKSDRLGGHLDTIDLELDGARHSIDAGVHFFSEALQPTFVRLLRQLGAPFAPYDSTATFFDRRDGWTVSMPPFGGLARLAKLLDRRTLRALGALRTSIQIGIELVEGEGDFAITVDDFVRRARFPDEVCREFLLPYLGSYWGVLPDEVRGYSARNVLCYLVRHRPPLIKPRPSLRMIGGMRGYVDRLAGRLGSARIVKSAAIASIEKSGSGWSIGGERFDQIVLATSAQQAAAILGTHPRSELLSRVEYFETAIAIHGDPTFMPSERSDWSTVNAIFDGRAAALTTWQIDHRGVDLFRSWITHAPTPPARCHRIVKYLHPRPLPSYFEVQRRLAEQQGADGLWIAGMFAAGYDNHEGVLASAMNVARALAPGSRRLASLAGDREAA